MLVYSPVFIRKKFIFPQSGVKYNSGVLRVLRGNHFLFLIFTFTSVLVHAAAPSLCAPGWTIYSGTCTPIDISMDYYHHQGDPNGLQSLICGGTTATNGVLGSRIPVLSSFEPLPISTSLEPNNTYYSSDPGPPTTNNGSQYFGIRKQSSPQDFTYAYSSLPRCVCMGADVLPANPLPTPQDDTDTFSNHNTLSPGVSRIYPDTFDVISTQDQSGSVLYNMVAYTSDPSVDGRQGSVFSVKNSKCGCPNINETAVPNATSGGGIIGVNCQTLVGTPGTNTPGRILTTYDPKIHDSNSAVDTNVKMAMGKQIIQTPLDNSLGLKPTPTSEMIPVISIPTNAGGSQQYNRKIWTCAPPYTLSNGTCVPPTSSALSTYHTCGTGNSGEGIESPSAVGIFSKVVNKKLACCMNDIFATPRVAAGAFIKFDCIDNSDPSFSTSFNTLWGGNDSLVSSNGSSSVGNALVLAAQPKKFLTGFYTLNGARCDQYNEFGNNAITPQKLSLVNATWSAVPSGPAYPTVPDPTNSATNGPPQSATEMARCPILVRAAMIATCPINSDLPVVQRTFIDSSVTPNVKYCSSASSIQVHVRIEQVYEIAGSPKMKTIDTIQEQRTAAGISVDQIITQKNGSSCPQGSSMQGDVCVYN